jgi:cytochrome c oxidase subunit II
MRVMVSVRKAALVLLTFVGCVSLHVTAAETNPHTIDVTAKRFSYSPAEITVKKGEQVVLNVKSEDVPHGLKFSELHLDTKIPKGKTAQLTFVPDKVGTFVGQCSVFCGSGHGSMKLTLHVVE